jgi:hypothetical protein
VLTYLKNWDKLFESPFKSDVYFFSTRLQLDCKWGTPNPITIRDKDFGMVRMRAFGIYSYKLTDARKFHSEISGYARAIHGRRPRWSVAQPGDQLDDRPVRRIGRAVHRHGGQPGRVEPDPERQAGGGLRALRTGARQLSSCRTFRCRKNSRRSSIRASA